MKTVNATINGTKVTIGIIEAGEKPRQVREAMGIEFSENTSLIMRGEDFSDEQDLKHSFSKTYQALKDADVNCATMRGYIEVRK
jgi:hypothetical protein